VTRLASSPTTSERRIDSSPGNAKSRDGSKHHRVAGTRRPFLRTVHRTALSRLEPTELGLLSGALPKVLSICAITASISRPGPRRARF
jgi:hypothetical protein